jgi:hypothetical protein
METNKDAKRLAEAIFLQSESMHCTTADTYCGLYNPGAEPDQCNVCKTDNTE